PSVIGTNVMVGRESATIVGVMPEGFGFPIAQNLWLPLRVSVGNATPLAGPAVLLFGRLPAGASLDDARAEVKAVSEALAASSPETHDHLRADVAPMAQAMIRSMLGEVFAGGVSDGALLVLLPTSVNIL